MIFPLVLRSRKVSAVFGALYFLAALNLSYQSYRILAGTPLKYPSGPGGVQMIFVFVALFAGALVTVVAIAKYLLNLQPRKTEENDAL